jgi:hypothetical protein
VTDGAEPVLDSLHGQRRALLQQEGLSEWTERRTRMASSVAVLGLIGGKQRWSTGKQPSGGESECESEQR